MKEYQKEYESYIKIITDDFIALCSHKGMEELFFDEKIYPIRINQYQRLLFEYYSDLKYSYRNEAIDELNKSFYKKRQELAQKFLKEHIITYDEFIKTIIGNR